MLPRAATSLVGEQNACCWWNILPMYPTISPDQEAHKREAGTCGELYPPKISEGGVQDAYARALN